MGVLDIGERDKNNETGLKEGGGIEMSTTVLSIYAMLALLLLDYLPLLTRSLMAPTSLKCATNPPIVETAQSLIS